MKKSAMLLAIITCVLCLSAGYFIGQSKRDNFTVNLNPKDTVTTRDYTLDVYSDPGGSVFEKTHITFKLTGKTVTEGINND